MIDESPTLTHQGRDQQLRRFEALRALGAFHERSLLELGCGNGEFYHYLRSCGVRPFYTGLDASAELAAEARARFAGEETCRFEVGRAADFQPASAFDYVIASVPPAADSVVSGGPALAQALTRLFSWCTIGAAAILPTTRAPARLPRPVRVDPAAALKAALRLTPAVRLAHDFLPADFTVYLYRTPAWGIVGEKGAS